MTAAELAQLLEATVDGDASVELSGGATLEAAGASDVVFVDSREAVAEAGRTAAGCLLMRVGADAPAGKTVIRVGKPRNAFAAAMRALRPPERPAAGVHGTAVVADSAVIGEGAHVGAHVVIEDGVRIGASAVVQAGSFVGRGSSLGDGAFAHANVTIYAGVEIGARTMLHAGCVIGADGFGFVLEGGRYEKFPQIGGVKIGSDVEIGANACVDRGALGDTVIRDGAKIDNLVHIGHNCQIGNHVVIAAQVGLSGGVRMDDYVVVGGQAGLGEQAHIEAQAVLGGQCGVLPNKTVAGGKAYWGTPARPHREYLKKLALVEKLPEIVAELEALRARVEAVSTER
jgi:UDP-3-O-[3-hydroxymyristoyl] glucosamine N-acyltransferase